jgi:hypothetical protein
MKLLSAAARMCCGLLLVATVFACDAPLPSSTDTERNAALDLQNCVPENLDAVYSGPPARENGVINLNDQFVYVEVHNIEIHLVPRNTSANDVRMGATWATGTPAESFAILDIDGDGKRDIRLVFSKSKLVADGNLTQQTTTLTVWGLNRNTNNEHCGSRSADVTLPPPAPGQDVVVLNDINIFDANAMNNANNVLMVQQLVNYTGSGPRASGDVVVFDRGRNAPCGPSGNAECNNSNMAIMRSTIEGEGFSITDITSSSGSLTSIPADVKVIFLWTPTVPFTIAEINTLKQFAADGGRIVFIGEWDGYYGNAGIATENDFLAKMGAVMTNTGGAVNCNYNTLPESSLRSHQVTDGLTALVIACASVIIPGPQDFVLFYDLGETQVLAGVARIDTSPLTEAQVAAIERSLAQISLAPRRTPSRLNVNSSTGR